MSSNLEVHMFPCLSDNYGYLIHDAANNLTATIDTPDAHAIQDALDKKGWTLTHILNTHHHADHAGGNLALKESSGCTIVGAGHDARRIPGIDVKVQEGDVCQFGDHSIQVLETPGHTLGHIVYYIPGQSMAFVGDTLFAMGCGRLFEGSADQMWSSLSKLLEWPDETVIYCAHEYTLANGKFAMSVDPLNPDLQQRMKEVEQLRSNNQPTIPTNMKVEKATNPFLRAEADSLIQYLGMQGKSAVDVFAETRSRKDNF